jgi:hypothetical protein
MKACAYGGRENEDNAVNCKECGTAEFATPVPHSQRMPTIPSVEFIRMFFNSPVEEEFAVRCTQFLARIIGERIIELRPDMKWSEICKLLGPTPAHAFVLSYKLRTEFGEVAKDLIANLDFMTFREFVEAACQSKCV